MLCVRLTSFSLAIVLAAIALRSAGADEPAAGEVHPPQIVNLTVAPAGEPRPALRYRLLPAPHERLPGNGAIFYYRAMLALKSLPVEHWKEYDQKSAAWLAAPLDQLPRDEVRKWIGPGSMYGELQKAAYREHCDWDLRVQDLRGLDTIYLLLEDAQQCRSLARKLQLKARLEMSEGRYADALETLRLGYQLGRDVAQTPLLINGLIGVAITAVMNGELMKLIEASDANYYWALAALPQPVIDMRPAIEYEMNIPNQIFPFLKDAETAERAPEEWQRLIVEFLRALPELGSGPIPRQPDWQLQLGAAALMTKLYPVAKERLIAGGMPRERVEAMPVGQVVAIHTARAQRFVYDEVGKLYYLPADEALRRDAQLVERLQSQGFLRSGLSGEEGLPIASLMLPAVSNVRVASIRLDRDRAALMAIEALRLHAAQTGQLPAALNEVTVVPVPVNPVTGQPFPYRLDAAQGEATLDVPATDGNNARRDARRYVVRLRK